MAADSAEVDWVVVDLVVAVMAEDWAEEVTAVGLVVVDLGVAG